MENGKPRATVLVIDDEPANLRVVVRHLQAYSFDIITARDGETGLLRAVQSRPELILLDIAMPGIDGYETCRRLKANPATASIPVIFLTARVEPEDKVHAFDCGAVDYVTKPIESRELLARVRAHVQICGLRAELERQNADLEARVARRTAELERELREREAYQREREHLLELVRLQSEQLQGLTRQWVETQRDRDRGLSRSLGERIAEQLGLLHLHLEQARVLLGEKGVAGEAELQGHLDTALELLPPVLHEALAVRRSLDDVSAAAALDENPLLRLSTREWEVVQLLLEGRQNKQIASTLGVARTTVSTYRNRILEKLGVPNLTELVKLTLRFEGPAEAGEDRAG